MGSTHCTVVLPDEAAPPKAAATGSSDPASEPASLHGPKPSRPRTYYIDHLRVFLTVLVLVHHCACSYMTASPWAARKGGDQALSFLFEFFVNANQAYFMTLFFFLSGLYVPSSFERKGARHFLSDRSLRLVTPCIFYSFLVPPFNSWWDQVALGAAGHPDFAASFRKWLTPTGWPTAYILPTGPPWFIWMLWCFNVAYVVLRLAGDSPPGRSLAGWLSSCGRALRSRTRVQQAPEAGTAAAPVPRGEFTGRQCLLGGSAVAGVCFTLCYSVRALDLAVWHLFPASFVKRGPFVSFMPDFFVVYALAFALGIQAGPSRWDVLRRLPASWCWPLLCASGLWWVQAGFLPNMLLFAALKGQAGPGAQLAAWLWRTFVEQTFAVAWSAGLLLLFREQFNIKPGRLGRQVIAGAYGAYIVHIPLIGLFAAAMMPLAAPSLVVNATAISVPVVVAAWAVACALRAIPGADRVL